MKKRKKKLSGMTLVEVIISIAVFAAITLILTLLGRAVESHQRTAKRINDKVAVQGPIAEAQNEKSALLVDDEYEITVQKSGDASAEVVVKGKLYSAEPFSVDNNGNQIPDPTADNANLKFIEIEKPTESST